MKAHRTPLSRLRAALAGRLAQGSVAFAGTGAPAGDGSGASAAGRRLRLAPVTALALATLAFALLAASPASAATSFGSYGSEAGQLNNPLGLAASQKEGGDVYVSDVSNYRIDKFSPSGEFRLAWGLGLENGALELQTCTTECRIGAWTQTPGAVTPAGIAVDNKPSSGSYGDVYVVDRFGGRVEKFGPDGEFLLEIGGGVDQGPNHPGNLCTAAYIAAGDTCGRGSYGTGNGEFSYWPNLGNFIALDPSGDLFVGDAGRIQVFESSGAWKEDISLTGLSETNRPYAIAIDPAGHLFLKDQYISGVRELELSGGVWTESATQFDSASNRIEALAADASGHLFVTDTEGGFHVLEYDTATGNELASFGFETAATGLNVGLAFSSATQNLYTNAIGSHSAVWVLSPPPPGPLAFAAAATPELHGNATLEAKLNPEGTSPTEYHFEYVTQAHYEQSGFSEPLTTPIESITTELFENHPVSAPLSDLVPGTTYRWRLVAVNAKGEAKLEGPSFEEIPAVRIEGPWATDVTSTTARVGAKLENPQGLGTTYRLEYGTGLSYGHVLLEGTMGASEASLSIGHALQGLQPSTTYHFRVVAENECEPAHPGHLCLVESPDRSFTTQALAAAFALPDNRAWELVSPPEKHGGAIGIHEGIGDIQAAADGEGVSYLASAPITETAQQGGTAYNPVLSARTGAGWSSREFMPSASLPEGEGREASNLGTAATALGLLSPDLSQALIEPASFVKPLSPEATEPTLYLHDTRSGSYLPLVTPANVPPGTVLEACEGSGMHFLDATPDLSHVAFYAVAALTPEAHVDTRSDACNRSELGPISLYEWVSGGLKDVGILPNGEAVAPAFLGQQEVLYDRLQHAISNDGRWIVWSTNLLESRLPTLYLRDMTKPTSVQLAGPGGRFETMTPDGSRVFFLKGGELHSFETTTSTDADLTAPLVPAGTHAQVQAVIGASEDGKTLYLVAKGVLSGEEENAAGERVVSGQPNLYLLRESGGAWTATYIATLSPADEHSWQARSDWGFEATRVTSHLSPDGRWLAFMSQRPLTRYDNTDAASGERDEEVFLYDAQSARLICASCDPTGARPQGMYDLESSQSGPLVDPGNAWGGRWIAGSMPGWRRPATTTVGLYEPRELGDSGRLFFQSAGALVPQDTNGKEDVYEYEPTGVGNCTEASPTYSSAAGGCVSLISSGTSSQESVFYDASESGKDVFFATASQLAPQDGDREVDVYDARSPHVPGEAVGFPLPQRPPACEGDACQAPVAAPNDETPSSSTYHGPGNEHPAHKRKRHRRHHRAKHHRRARSNRGGHK